MTTEHSQYEVVDGYGKAWFTGTLMECGVWIDPVLGVDFDHSMWGEDGPHRDGGIDDDRFTLNPDGSYTVLMYEGGGGIGGEMTVRPTRG